MPQTKQELLEKLNSAKFEGGGHVTYIYENGVKQRQPINKSTFYNDKKRDKNLDDVLEVFEDTAHDLGAVSFEL
jgi:hypothetical protein